MIWVIAGNRQQFEDYVHENEFGSLVEMHQMIYVTPESPPTGKRAQEIRLVGTWIEQFRGVAARGTAQEAAVRLFNTLRDLQSRMEK